MNGSNQETHERDGATKRSPSVDELRAQYAQFNPGQESLWQCRPYVLIPLLEGAGPLRAAIVENTKKRAAFQRVTDIYVVSHGWHRNYFDAVAAYDRLISRFILLRHRNRLKHVPTGFEPLFLMLHWHSDPGKDRWIDPAGRRDKDSFLSNVCDKFAPRNPASPNAQAELTNFFEDVYELFSNLSAPDIDARSDTLTSRSHELWHILDRGYALRDAAGATVQEKCAVLWRCYHEADARRRLVDDENRPGRFMSFYSALLAVINFLSGAGFLTGLLLYILRLAPGLTTFRPVAQTIRFLASVAIVGPYIELLRHTPTGVWNRIHDGHSGVRAWILDAAALLSQYGVIIVFLGLLALLYLLGRSWNVSRLKHKGRRTPYLALLSWVVLEAISLAFLALFIVPSFLFGKAMNHVFRPLWGAPQTPGLFDERIGQRDTEPISAEMEPRTGKDWSIRSVLFSVPRLPIALLRRGMGKDSRYDSLLASLDNQLAFAEMQMKGTRAGVSAASCVAEIASSLPASVRVHFVGHSFGSLVVLNTVRTLCLHPDTRRTYEGDGQSGSKGVESVCLIEAAVASCWLEEEVEMLQYVKGCIGNIYSRYDSACGFYYPVANCARLAAGGVGLFGGTTFVPEQRCRFASLVRTPNLDADLYRHGCAGYPPTTVEPEDSGSVTVASPTVYNLDASRIIYNGPVTLGGGHDDIFKEDVLQLAWAVTIVRSRHAQDHADAAGHSGETIAGADLESQGADVAVMLETPRRLTYRIICLLALSLAIVSALSQAVLRPIRLKPDQSRGQADEA